MDIKSSWGYSPFRFHWSPTLGARCCERNDTKTRHTHKRQTPLWPEEKALRKQASLRFTFIYPPWAEFQTVWLSLLSIVHVHKCYRTAKGSEIPVYCRVCPEPFLPPYHRKGMFPRLQGTIKLKAVSRLFGRTPCMQGPSVRATLLTLHCAPFCFVWLPGGKLFKMWN